MAREATITQEEVNAVADAIRATGTKPTARSVRESLGTGSMATVLKYLQTWQAGQVKPVAHDMTLPPALTRSLVDFIGQEVAQAKAGLEADLAAALQGNSDLIAESERQAASIEAQEKALEEAYCDKAELMGKLGQMESDLAVARDEIARERQASEAARTELAKAQLRLEAVPRIEAEVDSLREALESSDKARQEAEQSAAVLAAKLEASEASRADLVRQLEKAEARAERAEAAAQAKVGELVQANTVIQACNARLESAERELTGTRKSAEEARSAAKKAGEEAAETRGELVSTKAALEAARKAEKKEQK
jgi:Plasmid replication region DNA-binding N-term.